MTSTTLVTADQLLHMPKDGYHHYELVAGELRIMTPAGWRHGDVAGRLYDLVAAHVHSHGLGKVFAAETGFLLARDPDTVRAPDVAFLANEHIPATLPAETFWPGAPDLAVEVVSFDDTAREVDEKARAWLAAGSRMVWVVNPKSRTVDVYRPAVDVETLTEGDSLSGGDVLAGFACPVAEIFANR